MPLLFQLWEALVVEPGQGEKTSSEKSVELSAEEDVCVLYLQYGDESRQIRMPNQISSVDTVRAMFVGAFPQQLTMKMLESPSVAVYVKDDMRNMYYELADVRSITAHSCLKVYHKDPAQAFSQTPRPSNGDPSRFGSCGSALCFLWFCGVFPVVPVVLHCVSCGSVVFPVVLLCFLWFCCVSCGSVACFLWFLWFCTVFPVVLQFRSCGSAVYFLRVSAI
ncbi:unnamed protein product [Boreogadus saida]